MGLFDWMLHGLGFETTTKKEKKAKKGKGEDFSQLNMAESTAQKMESVNNNVNNANGNMGFNSGFGIQTESNMILIDPKNQKDIHQVVDYLKQGQSVAVNLGNIADVDRSKILDFLSGAIYALDGSLHRWKDDLYLLTPSGHKILRKG